MLTVGIIGLFSSLFIQLDIFTMYKGMLADTLAKALIIHKAGAETSSLRVFTV